MRTLLTDGRLTLRRWRRDDARALLNLAQESAAEIGPWMMWTDAVTDQAGAEQFIADRLTQWDNGDGYGFVAVDVEGRLLGGGALGHFNRQHRLGNVGYFVRTGERGRGRAVALSRLLVLFGFEDLRLQRLEILVEPANLASQRVAEKLGAVREGTLRHRLLIHGEPRDAIMFSLLPGTVRLDSAAVAPGEASG
jgi:RimJ/RimL family protein N-acetyltransferase